MATALRRPAAAASGVEAVRQGSEQGRRQAALCEFKRDALPGKSWQELSQAQGRNLDLPSCSSQGTLSDCSDYDCFSIYTDFPGGSDGKESACNARDLISVRVGKIPWILLPRSLGGGHGNPLQYSCLENPLDRGAWWASVQGVTKSGT